MQRSLLMNCERDKLVVRDRRKRLIRFIWLVLFIV